MLIKMNRLLDMEGRYKAKNKKVTEREKENKNKANGMNH